MASPILGQLLSRVRNRHLVTTDIILLTLAAVMAFALRLDSGQIRPYVQTMLIYAIAAPIIKLPIFAGLGLYARFWQYAGTDEMMLLVWAAAIGALTQGALFLGTQAFFPALLVPGVPRSIPLIDALVTFAVIAAPRFALRTGTLNAQRAGKKEGSSGPLRHVLIAGAGQAGAMVLRELHQNPQTGLLPVGFIDDDPAKHGVLLRRVRVLGGRDAIPALVAEHHVEQVIIAMPSAPGKTIREIVDICEAAGVRARIVPGIYELLGGAVRLKQLRDVQIDDLLRREPVRTDAERVEALLRGKRVLVTGAGGSIGSELCRQILRCCPSSLVLLGHGENSIFDIHNELRAKLEGSDSPCPPGRQPQITPVVADVRFAERLNHIFKEHRPEVVFHAAAHKHVPLMEDNIGDAITNNILGTLRVVEASAAAGVTHFVLISTDKAVNPSSIMGATKRVAELIVQRAARSTGCAFVAVRFGNVLGSRGSVVPFFQKQIAAGGPVTVTHPDVRRYFMTIPEAVQLVLQAATMGRGDEMFVLDMGEPVRIVDLARDLIRLSGLEPDRDVKIRFTGLRAGEKLFEELFTSWEQYGRTDHEKILRFVNGHLAEGSTDGGEEAEESFLERLDALFVATQCQDEAGMRLALRSLVPEYNPETSEEAPVRTRSLGPRAWRPPGWSPPGAAAFLDGLVNDSESLTAWASSDPDAGWGDWLARLGLAPYAWHQLKASGCAPMMPAPLAQVLRGAYYAAVADAQLHAGELRDVLACLADAHVAPVLFKGAALAYVAYPDPACRPMGDLDLWVTEEEMPRARAALAQAGYREGGKPNRPLDLQHQTSGEVQLIGARPGHGLVELHWGIYPGEWVRRTASIDNAGIRARARAVRILGCDTRTLAPEDTIVQLSAHLAVNHQMAYPGLRGLLDILLAARAADVDWLALADRARTSRLKTCTWLALSLADELFGLDGADEGIKRLEPSAPRRALLHRFVDAQYILEGRDMTGGPKRLAFQLLLVDRARDAVRLVGRTLWPERDWLRARYGAAELRVRARHMAGAVRGKI